MHEVDDPSDLIKVPVDASGALPADLNTGVLEEVCRLGGVLRLPRGVWNGTWLS